MAEPILLSILPGRPVHRDVTDLKRSARIVVFVWVAPCPLLPAETGYALWNLPRMVSTSPRSLVEQLPGTISAFSDGRIATELVGVIESLVLICSMVARPT
ncbi:hypothetical protein [Streptomyces sp. NPDC002265]|uniref:hypothetical protein n=1 Tax=Streptomyces sp. NPDC002265 TaxID=3154415 RepID=UPI00332FAC14